MLQFFLKYVEIILTAAGVLVVAFVPGLFSQTEADLMVARAATAILVGVIHGFIFFAIRYRQRQVREETINEIRMMLRDVVNNHLTVISIAASGNPEATQATKRVMQATTNITNALNNISEESLASWKQKYDSAIP